MQSEWNASTKKDSINLKYNIPYLAEMIVLLTPLHGAGKINLSFYAILIYLLLDFFASLSTLALKHGSQPKGEITLSCLLDYKAVVKLLRVLR